MCKQRKVATARVRLGAEFALPNRQDGRLGREVEILSVNGCPFADQASVYSQPEYADQWLRRDLPVGSEMSAVILENAPEAREEDPRIPEFEISLRHVGGAPDAKRLRSLLGGAQETAPAAAPADTAPPPRAAEFDEELF